MMKPINGQSVMMSSLALLVAACGSGSTAPEASSSETGTASPAAAVTFPASLVVVGDGYPSTGSPCRRVGESEATSDLLDDSADLVACPTKADAEALKGKIVGLVDGFSLVSVPRGDANAGMAESTPMNPPVKQASAQGTRDYIRGKGGLEEKCLKAVGAQGTTVIGTNRIEESEAATAIYVNVKGGQAPWRCLGYRDGTIGDVMYTGDEGAL